MLQVSDDVPNIFLSPGQSRCASDIARATISKVDPYHAPILLGTFITSTSLAVKVKIVEL